MRIVLGVLAVGLAVAACQPRTATEPVASEAAPAAASDATATTPAFSHDPAVDAFGFYMPTSDIQVGNLRLDNIAVGTPDELREWEAGKRTETYAPVMMTFEDVTSPMQSNEMGGESHSVQVRVLPVRYAVDGHTLSFAGKDAKLGDVLFQGSWDMAAIKKAQGGEPAGDAPVLTGRLTAGGKTFEDARFTWFGGD